MKTMNRTTSNEGKVARPAKRTCREAMATTTSPAERTSALRPGLANVRHLGGAS